MLVYVWQVLLEIIFFIKQTDTIFSPQIISIHILCVKDLGSFSSSTGNFGDKNTLEDGACTLYLP